MLVEGEHPQMDMPTQIPDLLATIPTAIQRNARDYLTAGRLRRRLRQGTALYAAELRGYQDVYHVWLTSCQTPSLSCTCDRARGICTHAAALLLDLDSSPDLYTEASWAAAVQTLHDQPKWPFGSGLDWNLITEQRPWWRVPFNPQYLEEFMQIAEAPSRPLNLGRDPAAALWAEMDISWMSQDFVIALFDQWLKNHNKLSPQDLPLWALLHWMQPSLPLDWLFLTADQPNTVKSLLRQLFHPGPLINSTSARREAILSDLTLVQPELAMVLWDLADDLDPYHFRQADALYLAGRSKDAAALLEHEMPTDPIARRQARQRLIQWVDLNDSLPHRMALAWEKGSLEVLLPVRHLIKSEDWLSITRALEETGTSGSPAGDPE